MPQVAAKTSRPPGGRRVGRAEVARRLTLVERVMLEGGGRADIARALPKIPARTLDDYVKRVRERWLADAQVERRFTRARQLRRLYCYLRVLEKKGLHREILTCETKIGELEGNELSADELRRLDQASRRAHNLTWEQIEWMAANGGRLPPGVTLADLGDL